MSSPSFQIKAPAGMGAPASSCFWNIRFYLIIMDSSK